MADKASNYKVTEAQKLVKKAEKLEVVPFLPNW